MAGPAQGPPGSKGRRQRQIPGRLPGSRRLQRPGVEALESRMLLSASDSVTTWLRQVPAVVSKPPLEIASGKSGAAVSLSGQSSQNGTAGRVSTPQLVISTAIGSAGSTSKGLKIEPAPTPSISLKYSYSSTVSSSSPILVSTPVPPATVSVPVPGPENSDPPVQDPEASELTPQGVQHLAALPWTNDLEVSGTLQPAQTWMTYRIPVGPTTQSLKVTVSPQGAQAAPAVPKLDQVYLVGPSGTLLTQLKGASAYAQGPSQDMTISLSAVPTGSELLFRIVESPGTTAAGPLQQSAADPIVSFTMDVQRTELAQGTLPFSSTLLQTVAPVGSGGSLSIAFGNLAVTVSPPSLAFPGNALDQQTAGLELTGTASSTVATTTAGARLATQVEVPAPGVSVGPLVSRGSAPLGPLLGTTQGEPTPSIDRYERAFDLAALGAGAGADPELLLGLAANRSDGIGEDAAVSEAPGTTGPLVSLRGPGGLPVAVTSIRGGQSLIDPAAVLATLPAQAVLPGTGEKIASLPALPPLEISGSVRRGGDELACTDFLKAACGLMLGIGLTTGPLYPDLMALVRTCLPRRNFLTGRPRGSRAYRKGPLGSFRRWLGLG